MGCSGRVQVVGVEVGDGEVHLRWLAQRWSTTMEESIQIEELPLAGTMDFAPMLDLP